MVIAEKYKNAYGTWLVSTENNSDGTERKLLGTFKGYVDEIALHLAEKGYYGLNFQTWEQPEKFTPSRTEVDVSFGIDSNTWNISADERVADLKDVFRDRPVDISRSNYYASFKIKMQKSDIKEYERQIALDKLTDADKQILGLTT